MQLPYPASPGERSATGPFALRCFDEASEQESSLPGWQQRYNQLSSGHFTGSVARLVLSGVTILRERINVAVEQTYATPSDKVVYFGIASASGAFSVERRCLTGGALGIGRSWSRMEVSSCGSDIVFAMVDATAFEEAMCPIAGEFKIVSNPACLPDMTEWLHSILEVYANGENDRVRGLDVILPDLVRDRIGAILQLHGPMSVGAGRQKSRAEEAHLFWRVGEWLGDNPQELATVGRLSQELAVPASKLRCACVGVLGHGLDDLLLKRRLGQARRDIISARETRRRISDIALDHGFTHWGRFAGIYRQFFGEKPSETLRSGGVRRSERLRFE